LDEDMPLREAMAMGWGCLMDVGEQQISCGGLTTRKARVAAGLYGLVQKGNGNDKSRSPAGMTTRKAKATA
jgi:hypothetical protein